MIEKVEDSKSETLSSTRHLDHIKEIAEGRHKRVQGPPGGLVCDDRLRLLVVRSSGPSEKRHDRWHVHFPFL
jgi:hypothetical protein